MTTVAELRSRVGRMLSDPEYQGYSDELFYDAVNAALDAILPWVPKQSIYQIVGDASDTYKLPSDCYQIEACVDDATGLMLPKAILIPGLYTGEQAEGNNWLEYPHGSVSFSSPLEVGETYSLYYLAHWTKPTGSQMSDLLEPPSYSHLGICLYATAYMLLPASVSASEVRQWATKVDSGNPEHNPMQQSTIYLLKLFADEMNRHPRHQKAQR